MKWADDPDLRLDCIEMKRRIQADIHEATKHLTTAELLEYYDRRSREGPLASWWKTLREKDPDRKDGEGPEGAP